MRNYTKITIFFASSGLPYGMIAGVPGVTGLPVANHVAEARLPERGNVWCRPGWCFTDKAVFVGLIDRSTSYNSHQARLDKLIWLRSSFLHCLLFKNRSTNPCICHRVNLKRLEKCCVWRDNPTKTGYGLVPMKHGPNLIKGTQTWTWFEWYPMQYWRFIDLQKTIFAWSPRTGSLSRYVLKVYKQYGPDKGNCQGTDIQYNTCNMLVCKHSLLSKIKGRRCNCSLLI